MLPAGGLAKRLLLAGLVGVVSLLGFVGPSSAQHETSCTDDAMLVFDASGSMASVGYNELYQPRIHDALDAMRRVLPQVTPYRRIGLVTYGPGPKDVCSNIDVRLPPISNAASRIIGELEKLEPDGNTPLTQSVEEAAEALKYREQPAVVVLVTDGDETCGGRPCRVAGALKAAGAAITVHVIGFKVRDRFFQWQSQARDNTSGHVRSRCMADMTGGQYLTAETTDELVAALQKTLGCPLLGDAREFVPAIKSTRVSPRPDALYARPPSRPAAY